MESDPLGGTLELSDPVLMAHIETQTDLLRKFRGNEGDENFQSTTFDPDEFYNFAIDEIKNEATCIEQYDRTVPSCESEEAFPHMVMEYQGIYFYSSIEYSDIGFWLEKSSACEYAAGAANP